MTGIPRGGKASPAVNHERLVRPMPTRIRPPAIGAAMAAAPPTHGSPSLNEGNRASIAPDAMAMTMAPLSPTSTARTTPSGLR